MSGPTDDPAEGADYSACDIDEARELASAWAPARIQDDLGAVERARLFAWVRERLKALHVESGSPIVGSTWRNWAAMRVGQKLFDDGTTGPVDALCEASGWPS